MNDIHHHVAAGSFFVGRREAIILQAYLGTCVGVALFDDQSGVGGLIHLLLPEPISPLSNFQAEKYATKGMPLFLEALAATGADPGRMRGAIAGGALVGPVSHQDLSLDVGGRTADIARRIVNDAGIELTQSETGGFFTCRLGLNMQTGECRIDPAGSDRYEPAVPPHTPSSEEVEAGIEKVRPIPQVALKIMRLIDQGAYDIDTVVDQVRQDQVIAAQVLRLCNSPLIAPRQPVTSLEHALAFIGPRSLQRYVIAAALEGFFGQAAMGYSLCKGGLYHHSMGTALIAEHLARITGRTPPPQAYTAGLLHDIGKVLLDQFISGAYPLFYRSLRETGEDLLTAEKRLFGLDHTEAGALLAARWKLPPVIRTVIADHHRPAGQVPDPDPLFHAVALAELLMYRFNAGLELERLDTKNLTGHLHALGLDPTDLPALIDRLPPEIFGHWPAAALSPIADGRTAAVGNRRSHRR